MIDLTWSLMLKDILEFIGELTIVIAVPFMIVGYVKIQDHTKKKE